MIAYQTIAIDDIPTQYPSYRSVWADVADQVASLAGSDMAVMVPVDGRRLPTLRASLKNACQKRGHSITTRTSKDKSILYVWAVRA